VVSDRHDLLCKSLKRNLAITCVTVFQLSTFLLFMKLRRGAYLGCIEITRSQLPQCLRKVFHPLFEFVFNLFGEVGPKRAGILPLSSELKAIKPVAWDDWTGS
jgi:hypothetical protein